MARWLMFSTLWFGCATAGPIEESATRPALPGTDSVCEQLTESSEQGPHGAFYRCRLEGQSCIVLQSYYAAGGLSIDCEDEED